MHRIVARRLVESQKGRCAGRGPRHEEPAVTHRLVDLTGLPLADLALLDEGLLEETLERLVLADRTRVWDNNGMTPGVGDAAAQE